MRRALSTVLVVGALVALVWTASSVNLGGRTAFGHIIAWCKSSGTLRSMVAWTKRRLEKGAVAKEHKQRPMPPADASRIEEAATAHRVALLDRAQKELVRDRPRTAASGHTRVTGSRQQRLPEGRPKARIDERISPRHKKSLDDLVTSRVARD